MRLTFSSPVGRVWVLSSVVSALAAKLKTASSRKERKLVKRKSSSILNGNPVIRLSNAYNPQIGNLFRLPADQPEGNLAGLLPQIPSDFRLKRP